MGRDTEHESVFTENGAVCEGCSSTLYIISPYL